MYCFKIKEYIRTDLLFKGFDFLKNEIKLYLKRSNRKKSANMNFRRILF